MAEQERAFLHFLLEANTRQAKVLLRIATPSQLQALGEVCYNARFGELEPEVVNTLKPYRHLVRQLSDKKLTTVQRRKLISRRVKAVLTILHLVKHILP